MATQTFPDTHTTTVTTSATRVSTNIRFDPEYVKIIPGILKISQCVVSIIGFIAITASCHGYCFGGASWYGFVSMTAFWVTLVLLGFYLFHLIEKLYFLPWIQAEGIYCAIWTLFYFIAALVVLVQSHGNGGFITGGFFGFIAMLLYGADAFFKYRAWQGGEIAQGERKTTTSTSPTNVSTAYPGY
ncbi:CMTM4 [Cordylochernes scorpioides]|uniref:CMTM4 n=1 Tax=Cordylochernes scorpioides TaxID=51811 RepID=A0ABY6KS01_9ARAC|nr:CMTM4 [Cordylochernes scorpioides]